MANDKQRRTLIYTRTHCGDPNPTTGVFGCNDCMKGGVRGRGFDAVIGIGGVGRDAELNGIARKLTWIGIGKHETIDDSSRRFVTRSNPLVTFDHFLYFERGQLLEDIAPYLAKRMYRRFGPRTLTDSLSSEERKDVETILRLAQNAPPPANGLNRTSTIPPGRNAPPASEGVQMSAVFGVRSDLPTSAAPPAKKVNHEMAPERFS